MKMSLKWTCAFSSSTLLVFAVIVIVNGTDSESQVHSDKIFTTNNKNATSQISLPDEHNNNNSNNHNIHSVEKLNEEKDSYWLRWRCTHTRQQFLQMFFSLIKNHSFSCPTKSEEEEEKEEKHEEEKSKVNKSVIIHKEDEKQLDNKLRNAEQGILTRRKRRKRESGGNENHLVEGHGEEIYDSDDQYHHGHVTVHYRNHLGHEQELQLTKLRGCKWENSTHSCHQHVLFVIEEPRCYSSSDETIIASDETDDVLDLMVNMEDEHPPAAKVWAYGFMCCTSVIIFARMGVIILPLLRRDLYEKLIITMVGLAAGTLTGSSIFHLLPKAFNLEQTDLTKSYLSQCAVIGLGLWLFLIIERLLKIIFHHKERKLHSSRRRKLSNVLASSSREDQIRVSVVSLPKFEEQFHDVKSNNEKASESYMCVDVSAQEKVNLCKQCSEKYDSDIQDKYRLSCNDLHSIQFQEGQLTQVSTDAWMLIVGDSFLDFVDGLSIGTAFHESIITGFSISLGILLEELPHELGEFAVLLNAGLGFRQALTFKFIASCTTYLGLCVGIWLGKIEAGHYVFAVASGYILYIALADMIPELNKAALKSSQTSVLKGLKVLFLQNVGLILGMSLIYIMSLYEDIFRKL